MLKAKATTKTWDPDAKVWTVSEEWEINIPENDEEREQLCNGDQVIDMEDGNDEGLQTLRA